MGEQPRPRTPSPGFSPHPHTSSRSAHTLGPLPSRPRALTYLCAPHHDLSPSPVQSCLAQPSWSPKAQARSLLLLRGACLVGSLIRAGPSPASLPAQPRAPPACLPFPLQPVITSLSPAPWGQPPSKDFPPAMIQACPEQLRCC